MAVEKTEKKNGGARPGAGRKAGGQNKATIEKQAAREAYRQLVLERLKPIFEHQYSLVKGTAFLYRITEDKKTGAKASAGRSTCW